MSYIKKVVIFITYSKFEIKEPIIHGFPTFSEDFIEEMELGYNQLFNRKE